MLTELLVKANKSFPWFWRCCVLPLMISCLMRRSLLEVLMSSPWLVHCLPSEFLVKVPCPSLGFEGAVSFPCWNPVFRLFHPQGNPFVLKVPCPSLSFEGAVSFPCPPKSFVGILFFGSCTIKETPVEPMSGDWFPSWTHVSGELPLLLAENVSVTTEGPETVFLFYCNVYGITFNLFNNSIDRHEF